jgi:hypothetical protein
VVFISGFSVKKLLEHPVVSRIKDNCEKCLDVVELCYIAYTISLRTEFSNTFIVAVLLAVISRGR